MSFSWITVNVGTEIKATHLNEVKTNTDVLADNLGIAHYSWSELPVNIGDDIEQVQIQEIQEALDYIDTNNICSTDNTNNNTTVDSSKDNSAFADHDSSVDNSNLTGYQSNQDNTINGTKNNTVHSSY
jgi:hypothetical protein